MAIAVWLEQQLRHWGGCSSRNEQREQSLGELEVSQLFYLGSSKRGCTLVLSELDLTVAHSGLLGLIITCIKLYLAADLYQELSTLPCACLERQSLKWGGHTSPLFHVRTWKVKAGGASAKTYLYTTVGFGQFSGEAARAEFSCICQKDAYILFAKLSPNRW